MKRREFLRLGLGAAAATAVGCKTWRSAATTAPSIVCVLIDQLRKDAVDRWAPRLSALSRRGVRFEQMRSAAPWTYPSVLSLMSGLYPQQHGASGSLRDKTLTTFSPDVPLVQSALQQAGYATAAFVTNPFLHTWNPFHDGFDHFDAQFVKNTGDRIPFPHEFAIPAAMFAQTVNAAVREHFGAATARRPEFTYVHYIDVHGPWAKAPFRPGYASSIRFIDGQVVDLYEFFMERYDGNVAFFVTSDHGRDLGDDLNIGYGKPWRRRKHSCHDFNLRVPFILLPSRLTPAPRSIRASCSQVDFVPTVYELAGLERSEPSAGYSLMPLVGGEKPPWRDRAVYAKVGDPETPSDAIVYRGRKYMRFFDPATGELKAARLFDLARDPRETESVVPVDAHYPAMIERMASTDGVSFVPEKAVLGRRTKEQLEALGYMR